jgi:molybdopterin/thiamine biosynthesis adenylyltransferase
LRLHKEELMKDIHWEMFGRNIGNITQEEQEALLGTTIAIAGTGGVGGAAAFNLARIGIGGLQMADPEDFASSDLNRQRGSSHDTVGKKKVEVVAAQIKAINPSIGLSLYQEGLKAENMNAFLEGVSLVIDGLDFFCLEIRKQLFDECRRRKLTILSCPIFGFGASLAVFAPDGPTYDEFFGPIPAKIDAGYAVSFGRSFFPRFPRYIDFAAYIEAMKKGRPIPSFSTSCALSGAVTAAEAVFILLGRRDPVLAPLIRNYDLHDATITVMNSRRKKLGFLRKWLLKRILMKKRGMEQHKEFVANL